MLRAVLGPGHWEDTHYVRVYTANLRKKIQADAAIQRPLVTESEIGDRFVPEMESVKVG